MKIQNYGYLTDCILHRYRGEIKERSDHLVIRTPSNPTHYWGNLLLFKEPPCDGDCDKMIDAYHSEFGAASGHVAIGWESQELGVVSEFKEKGYDVMEDIVLKLDHPRTPSRLNNGLIIEKIEDESQWNDVLELQAKEYVTWDSSEGFGVFRKRLLEGLRNLKNQGHGEWWGAYSEGKLIGSMGLYFDISRKVGRFQLVDTDSDHRRKGVCGTLLHHIVQDAYENSESPELFIVTEQDNPSARVYESVGFKRIQKMHGVSRSDHRNNQ